jgi:hypothetical protein
MKALGIKSTAPGIKSIYKQIFHVQLFDFTAPFSL